MKKLLSRACSVAAALLFLLFLNGCGNPYTEADLEDAKQQAYNEGFEDGYYRGSKDQQEKDYEDLLIDGSSIRNIEERVFNEYGVTPHEAFAIVDEYEYDSSHGGYTKAEYQNAIGAIFYTAAIFPYDY